METVAWELELPIKELPDDPSWRENFCFDGYDHERDIGFWIHCSRWTQDPTIWREQVLLYIPDGTYLVHRAWGRRESDKGPASALLSLTCIEPGTHWNLRYRGPARRTETRELQRGPLTEGPQLLLDLNIDFMTSAEMWDMGAGLKTAELGKFHIEQTGRLVGDISYEGKTVHMDGFGWHDHSRGSRSFANLLRHCWIHGNLSKDRSFALTVLENDADGTPVRVVEHAVVWEGNKLHHATCPNPPLLDAPVTPAPGYNLTLHYAGGTIDLRAETVRCLPHSSSDTMECYDGVTPGIAAVVTYEQGTIFMCDGERYNGHTERCYRL